MGTLCAESDGTETFSDRMMTFFGGSQSVGTVCAGLNHTWTPARTLFVKGLNLLPGLDRFKFSVLLSLPWRCALKY